MNPEAPNEVDVARPSDALEARAKTDAALRNLLVGLGAVGLLVGGVGITNVMVISVLERRSEIGVRRALGATRLHIAVQFLLEALLLSLLGGLGGAVLGSGVTAVYAESRSWRVDVPIGPLLLGVAVALVVGLLAACHRPSGLRVWILQNPSAQREGDFRDASTQPKVSDEGSRFSQGGR